MKNKKSLVPGTQLFNSLPLPSFINGKALLNANGDIDPSSSGFQYIIDTLTYIKSGVIDQKFYTVAPADYMPVDVGSAAWMEDIVQNVVFNTGGSFYQGDVDSQTETGRLAQVGAGLDKISQPVKTWAKGTGWTIMEIAKAAAASNWDIVESKLKSLKTNWDLGIQETAFLGHPDGSVTGLLNGAEVNVNTTLIAEPLSGMSGTDFQTFVAGLLAAYFANSNSTALPDTFVMPTSDYLGMIAAASPDFPNISKLEYLLNALKKATANENFKILPLAYAEDSNNASRGINKNRYVLYRQNDDTLNMNIPVDFTMLDADTSNKINWTQGAYGQYSGVLVNRPREVLYFDETAPST